jgi:hypothetical protein
MRQYREAQVVGSLIAHEQMIYHLHDSVYDLDNDQ